MADWLARYLDELAAAQGLTQVAAHSLRSAVADVILDAPHDVIEAVFTTAPFTGHLVVRFRIRDTFCRALARAAKDGLVGSTHGSIVFH